MNIENILRDYLNKNQYDGFYSEEQDCNCWISAFFKCTKTDKKPSCKPGVTKQIEGGIFIIGPREKSTPGEICHQLKCDGININDCPGNPRCPAVIFFTANPLEGIAAAEYMQKQIEKHREGKEEFFIPEW